MKQRIVLAYSGGLASSVAIRRLAAEHDAEVITLTLDLGEPTELDEVRARALALGALRAHVLDVREEFARNYVMPAIQTGALGDGCQRLTTKLAPALIAKKLAEIAAIENATSVACGTDIVMSDDERQEYARAHNIPIHSAPSRRGKAGAGLPETPARVDISFNGGVPTAVNDVPMRATELLESLTTIAAEHGIGSADDLYMPGAVVLHVSYVDGNASQLTGTVRLELFNGRCSVVERAPGTATRDPVEGATLAQV
jgi:argininosuccinate synthase